MSAEIIEVESRALLSIEQRAAMLGRMRPLGIVQIERVMIDYGERDGETVVLRLNNGKQEIVTKDGGVSAESRRARPEYPDPWVSLADTLGVLAGRGLVEAHVSRRRLFVARAVTDLTGPGSWPLEYSVRDVLIPWGGYHSSLLEVEAEGVQPGEEAAAQARTDATILALGLTLCEGADWEAWVHRIHGTVDERFVYSESAAATLGRVLSA
jgi:hypothetical protein